MAWNGHWDEVTGRVDALILTHASISSRNQHNVTDLKFTINKVLNCR